MGTEQILSRCLRVENRELEFVILSGAGAFTFPTFVILSGAPAKIFRPASVAGRAGAQSKDLRLFPTA
jgi:hypothetical protein